MSVQYRIDGRVPVVFSDFDGTITERDVIIMIMEAFAPPEWEDIVDRLLNRRTITIKEAVTTLFRLIPGSKRAEIERFVLENVRLRPGFPDFLDFCRAHGIPFLVVSGGVRFFIEPVLKPYWDKLQLFCNTSDFLPDRIELSFPYPGDDCEPCGQCACCKLGIMARYPQEVYYHIAVGDSLTDLAMSRRADWTFARSKLIDYTREENIPVTPFETFFEIQQHLSDRLVKETHHA